MSIPITYKPQRIHTYSDMMREAICYLRPDITPEMLAHETKANLREMYCFLKNEQQDANKSVLTGENI